MVITKFLIKIVFLYPMEFLLFDLCRDFYYIYKNIQLLLLKFYNTKIIVIIIIYIIIKILYPFYILFLYIINKNFYYNNDFNKKKNKLQYS